MFTKPFKPYESSNQNTRNKIKSPECSSVHSQQHFSDSNQISWIQKLVNGLQQSSMSRSKLTQQSDKCKYQKQKRSNFIDQIKQQNKDKIIEHFERNKTLQNHENRQNRQNLVKISSQQKNMKKYKTDKLQNCLKQDKFLLQFNNNSINQVTQNTILKDNLNESIGKIKRNNQNKQHDKNINLLSHSINSKSSKVYLDKQNYHPKILQRKNKFGEDQQFKNRKKIIEASKQKEIDQVEKLQSMEEKLDMILKRTKNKCNISENHLVAPQKISEKSKAPFFLNEPQSIKTEHEKNITTNSKYNKLLPKMEDIIIQQDSEQLSTSSNSKFSHHFKKVFQILDSHGIGVLNKDNCNILELSQDIKYLLGSVLSKIKYQSIKYNEEKFLTQCENIVGMLDNSQIKLLMQRMTPKSINLDTKRSDTTNRQSDSRRSFNQSVVVKKYQFMHPPNQIIRVQPYIDQYSVSNISSRRVTQRTEPQLVEPEKVTKIQLIALNKQPYIQTDDSRTYQTEQALNKQLKNENSNNEILQWQKDSFQKQEKIQHSKRIQMLNKKLTQYIQKIPVSHGNSLELKLYFDELTKNLQP